VVHIVTTVTNGLYYYTKRYQTRIRQAVHNPASFISKIMPPHFTLHTVNPLVHDNFSCWLRSDLTFPSEVHNTQGKDRPYIQETMWREYHGQHNSSAFEDPKNSVSAATFGAVILDGHSTVTGNGKPHNTAEKTNTQRSLACIYTTAKYPCVQKSKKIYIHNYCTGYSSRHANPLFTSPLPIAMYIMNKLYSCYTGTSDWSCTADVWRANTVPTERERRHECGLQRDASYRECVWVSRPSYVHVTVHRHDFLYNKTN
jgi:hypothetical protein